MILESGNNKMKQPSKSKNTPNQQQTITRSDIGSGWVYCDPKPDPIEIGFCCLKLDSTRKKSCRFSESWVRSRVGPFFFFFLNVKIV